MEENVSHKKKQYNYSKKMFTGTANPIPLTSVRMNGVLV